MRLVVTGAAGFIGRHVVEALGRTEGVTAVPVTRGTSPADLAAVLADAGAVIHLAGSNRPSDPADFATTNAGFTRRLCEALAATSRPVPMILASSTQAALDNPYGASKREAEDIVASYAEQTGSTVAIFRLTNVFGKWCRPNYNSVVATICHGVAQGAPFRIDDPTRELRLVHVDDVVRDLVAAALANAAPGVHRLESGPVTTIALGEVVRRVESFRESRQTLRLPDLSDRFTHALYSTYLSYLAPDDFAYPLQMRTDARGSLAEFVKSPTAGQIFVSRTFAGIERGNHYHHAKTEKFLVVEGEAVVRFRHIEGGDIIEHRVSGREFRVVDIPPGYTHSIENVGGGEMVVVFWASEEFDPQRPDTYPSPVKQLITT